MKLFNDYRRLIPRHILVLVKLDLIENHPIRLESLAHHESAQKYKNLPKVGRRVTGGPLGGDELLFRLEAVDERGVDVVAVGVAL